MAKLFVLYVVLILASHGALANRCAVLPNYIIDTEILSCKLVAHKNNETSQTVVVDVQVEDEIIFSPNRPISWKKI